MRPALASQRMHVQLVVVVLESCNLQVAFMLSVHNLMFDLGLLALLQSLCAMMFSCGRVS